MAKKLTERERQKKLERREQNKTKKKKEFALDFVKMIALIVAAATVISLAIWGTVTVYESYTSSNKYLSKYTPLSTEHASIDGAMLTYLYYDSYIGFVDYYSENDLYSMGLTEDAPLSELPCAYESYETWHDYFLQSAIMQAKELLLLYEDALTAEHTLSDAQKTALRTRVDSMDLSKYPNVTADDVYRVQELTATGLAHSQMLTDSFTPTTEEAEKDYNENTKYYQTVSFRCLEIPYGEPDQASFSREQALKYCNEFKSCKTNTEFTDQLNSFMDKCGLELSDNNKKEILDASYANGIEYSESDIVSEWLFSEDRAVGDTYVYDNEGTSSITVYMLTELPEILTSLTADPTVTVRHILFRNDTYGSKEAANAKAAEILARFNGTDRSADQFALLALTYSEDMSTAYIGGIYKNLEKNTMSESFDNWSFDPSRKPGDADLVESDYGTHIVYYIEKGDPSHIADVKKELAELEYKNYGQNIVDTIKINEDQEAIAKIKSAKGIGKK